MKLKKGAFIPIGVTLFSFVILLDYIYLLFKIEEEDIYKSIFGIQVNVEEINYQLISSFEVTAILFFWLFLFLVIGYIIEKILNKKNK